MRRGAARPPRRPRSVLRLAVRWLAHAATGSATTVGDRDRPRGGSRSLRGMTTAATSDAEQRDGGGDEHRGAHRVDERRLRGDGERVVAAPDLGDADAPRRPSPALASGAAGPCRHGTARSGAIRAPRRPSAPPTWRTVSFIADPTPACSFGSDDISASVAGVIARPMPNPISSEHGGDQAVAASDLGGRQQRRAPAATSARPAVTIGRGAEAHRQLRRHRRREDQADADRDDRLARLQRLVAEHRLQVLGEEEDRPEQGEEHQPDRCARRAEVAVAEQPHVQHRRRGVQLPDGERARAGPPTRPNELSTAGSPQPRSPPASMMPQTSVDDAGDRQRRAERVELRRLAGPSTRARAGPTARARRARSAR